MTRQERSEDAGELFPCGCRGHFEDHDGGKRQVIVVDPLCSADTRNIGRVVNHTRYEARDLRTGE